MHGSSYERADPGAPLIRGQRAGKGVSSYSRLSTHAPRPRMSAPEVTGRLLTRRGALAIGIAEFGTLLQAAPRPGTLKAPARSKW